MRHLVLPTLALLLLAPACARSRPVGGSTVSGADLARRLDKGDWMVRQKSEVWKVYEAQQVAGETRPPRHVGYLVRRAYRQERGGPAFHVYEVTTLNRKEVRGRIDELGRVTRYEPLRNGTFEERPVAASGLENNVASILGTDAVITLEKSSERRLAFEALDTNKSGLLEAAEIEPMGGSVAHADRNGDKQIDFDEFDAIDSL